MMILQIVFGMHARCLMFNNVQSLNNMHAFNH